MVAAARGQLDPSDLVKERAAERVAEARASHGLVSGELRAALVNISRTNVTAYTRRDGFAVAVAIVGGRRVWDVEDVFAYVHGLLIAPRVLYERQHDFVDSKDMAGLLGIQKDSLLAALCAKTPVFRGPMVQSQGSTTGCAT